MKDECKIFIFFNKFIKICGYISLLFPVSISIILIFNFNIYALFVVIAALIFIIILFYYYHVNRMEVYKDRIEYYGFKKRVFYLNEIKSLEVDKHGYIKIIYGNKKYLFSGFFSPLYKMPNDEKNKELVEYINKKIKENYRWY